MKAQADALFNELGMNLTTAFTIFIRQALREGGIPFEVKLEQPNKETIAAMLPMALSLYPNWLRYSFADIPVIFLKTLEK